MKAFNVNFLASICLWIAAAALLHYQVFNLGVGVALLAVVASVGAFLAVRKMSKELERRAEVVIVLPGGLPIGGRMPSRAELQKSADEGCDNPNCEVHGRGGMLEQMGIVPQRRQNKKWPPNVN